MLFLISSCKDELVELSDEQEIITKAGEGERIITTPLQTQMINNTAHTDYEVKDVVAGTYYLSAWVEIPLVNEKLPEYRIKINDELSLYTFKPIEPGFQALILTNSNNEPMPINLTNGNNKITLVSTGGEILNIEKLKLSASLKNALKEESEYLRYINECKNGNAFAQNLQTFGIAPKTKSDQIYDYALDVPVAYTNAVYFFWGKCRVKIKTSNATIPHVIEVFNDDISDNPKSYSYASYGYKSAMLDVIFPAKGFVTLRIRALNPGSEGTADYTINQYDQNKIVGGLSYTKIPVRGTVIPMNRSLSENYFLAKSTIGDHNIRMSLYAENTGKVIFNKNSTKVYSNPQNPSKYFTHDAYVNYAKKVSNIVVSIAAMQALKGTVDVYMGLPFASSDIYRVFPNLQKNNTFRSGEYNNDYNCISWSVERTDYWEWPGSFGSSYYDPNLLTAFDKLYAAYGYTRKGANESNAGIALWATSQDVSEITHASVTKNSNTRLPHGFDWESKCGKMERIMHERDGVRGNSYGSIYYYYTPVRTRSASRPIVNTELTDATKIRSKAISLKHNISLTKSVTFENKYNAWKETWKNTKISIQSNPRKYAESKEYAELLQLCREYKEESWPLFIEKLAEGDILAINLVEDLTFKENASLMEKVKKSSIGTRAADEPLPSMYSNYINYCTELLNSKKFNK